MRIKRKTIDKEINKKVYQWVSENKEDIIKKVDKLVKKKYSYRKSIRISIDDFEKSMEESIQQYAHKKIPSLNHLSYHADRHDFKRSLRMYLRKCIIEQLGYQKYFKEMFEKENDSKKTK